MKLEDSVSATQWGMRVGYVGAYLLMTTILWSVLIFFGFGPASWTLVHVVILTLSIAIVGALVRWSLE